ncbi:di-heme oxidoredictase family protein [Agriterribacter sp.]|uniref:di-heme oxidoredictase family protein n=1 Tax=Agriterribacter sp. TaxID=2821509 RepID=UPI002BA47253|nr:di-heme oxidoredictase family protein [Agriterribacter sp.]HTN07584.1 di-heme oxidoredictase family protein [Agriterribacter sp.]
MGKKQLLGILVLSVLITGIISCDKLLPDTPADDEILDGPMEGLTPEQRRIFLRGDVAFNDEIFSVTNGLGPRFVATSCGSCHAGDGKGHPFTTLTRFGQSDTLANGFLHLGGPQLQQRALPGFQPEQIPVGATFSKFTPPANTGLGLLETITDATILALADERDVDGDGISGRPNWINIPSYCLLRPGTVERNGKYIGRFGKKAAVYDLLQQTANAYNQDMGVNSTYEAYNTYDGLEIDPEISNQTVLDVVFYLQTLKAPIQRNENDADVIAGKQLFINISCSKCHTPQLQTGLSSIAALSNKTIFPYTDLLLHDMGPDLNDGYTEGTALPAEWRTPPLWGLGLSENSQGGQLFLMHDGRAKSIEEAILLHGGEASQSKINFQQLSSADKVRIIKFLESL